MITVLLIGLALWHADKIKEALAGILHIIATKVMGD
jgi:hypothetical protein